MTTATLIRPVRILPPTGQRAAYVRHPGTGRASSGMVLCHARDDRGAFAPILMRDGAVAICRGLAQAGERGWHAL